ncbi:CheR family methyltransferase [uncultured Massilia sp.]|uniref:CheR family methyltransferase n=1 Tax=uncultured Massilia sp. TaxID=169973 RepID=UPI0025FAB160|nr:CheR family methyltransferase [uncultured Massilia sp.]
MSLRHALEQATGLLLDAASVERAVRERLACGAAPARAAYSPQPGTAEFDALVDLVVVPESWLFRDPAVFDAALAFVRVRLQARPGQPVRILSLPCAGGEEPYSMAMALLDAGIDARQCRIDAVDLSAGAIARARAGRYGRNAFRGADLEFRARHCVRDGDEWVVSAAARAYVDFAQGNLFALDTLAQAGRYDLAFCRNLLIYFDAAGGARAAAVLHALLAHDGLLLSGYAEAPTFCRNGFLADAPEAPFALRRLAAGAAARPRRPAPSAANDAAPAAPMVAPAAPGSAPEFAPTRPAPRPRPAPADLLAQAQRHADAGRLAQAEQACREVLARLPEHAGAWFLLGMVHECAHDARAAERCWRRCIYLDPDHYEALCGLALLHERLGDAARGADLRRRAARIFERRRSGAA